MGDERNEDWCAAGGEQARMVDVVGQDGAFLGTRLLETGCCPERAAVRCVTWDLRTLFPATLEGYDPDRAARRRRRLARIVEADTTFQGWSIGADAFVIDGGQVRFCAVRGDEVREIDIR